MVVKANQWQAIMAEGIMAARERGIINATTVDSLMDSICRASGKTDFLDDHYRANQEWLQEFERRFPCGD